MFRLHSFDLVVKHNGKTLRAVVHPIEASADNGLPKSYAITLSGKPFGIIQRQLIGWRLNSPADPQLVAAIGRNIDEWYQNHQAAA